MENGPQAPSRFGPDDALRLAAERFGVSAFSAEAFSWGGSQGFILTEGASGRVYVLEVSPPETDPEILDLRNRILEHLGRAGFSLSKVVHSTDGHELVGIPSSEGGSILTRLLTGVPGTLLGEANPPTSALLRSLGAFLGGMNRALEGFSHPAQDRELESDLKAAGKVVRANLEMVSDPRNRELLGEMTERFMERLGPLIPDLRMGVIHGNAHNQNMVVNLPSPERGSEDRRVTGVLDFCDAVRSFLAGEAAIAGAHAMLGKKDPWTVAAQVVGGYHSAYPLSEAEIDAAVPLMGLRLCASVALSAREAGEERDGPSLTGNETERWSLLEAFERDGLEFPRYLIRDACGLEAVPSASAVVSWLEANGRAAAPVIGRMAGNSGEEMGLGILTGAGIPAGADPLNLSVSPLHVFDLSVDSAEFGLTPDPDDVRGWTDLLFRKMKAVGAEVGGERCTWGSTSSWMLGRPCMLPSTHGSTAFRRTRVIWITGPRCCWSTEWRPAISTMATPRGWRKILAGGAPRTPPSSSGPSTATWPRTCSPRCLRGRSSPRVLSSPRSAPSLATETGLRTFTSR
jgi:Ser/Thr protein kinase RdoA (MazF antagonist)